MIIEYTKQAIALILSGDSELLEIIKVSFSVSFTALAVVIVPALLFSFILSYTRFYGRWFIIALIQTLQAVPTVVIGLTLYLLFSRSGPLGAWQLLFSQQGMIVGQMLVCFPILVVMMQASFQQSDQRILETSLTLGTSYCRAFCTLIWECRFSFIAAVTAGFSRILTEVGCAMMVGGNILHETRNITTAIALESQKGRFDQGIALGLILLICALLLNLLLAFARGRSYLRN